MICKECGAYNPDHATYCKVCAASLKDEPEAAAPVASDPVTAPEPEVEQQPTKRFSRPSWVMPENNEDVQQAADDIATEAENMNADVARHAVEAENIVEETANEPQQEDVAPEVEDETPPIWSPSQARRRTALFDNNEESQDSDTAEDDGEEEGIYNDEEALEDEADSFEYEPTPPKRKQQKKKNNTMFTVLLIAIIVVIVGILVLGGYLLLRNQLKCSKTPIKNNTETASVTNPENENPANAADPANPVDPAQEEQSKLDAHNAQLQLTLDDSGHEQVAITVVVPANSTVTIDFPHQDDYQFANNESKDLTRKVKIPVEVFYPNEPLDQSELEIQPKITITGADGNSYPVACESFTRTFSKLNVTITSPVPDESGMIMAPESNVISLTGIVDGVAEGDGVVENITINGIGVQIYQGGLFMYDYKFDENATEDTEDTITITATKNNYVTDTKEITVHAYKFIPEPMTLEVKTEGKSLHTDKNGKLTVTGKTLPGAELTAVSDNTTNVLCGGVNVDPDGNFSFQITTDASFYGMSVITLDAQKEGAESASTKFTITKGFKDKDAFVKFYNKTKTYIELPKHASIPQLLSNQSQYATNAYGFRIEGTVVEVINIDGETIVKMTILKSNETVYVRNLSEKWAPGDNIGSKYRIYCNFVGTYEDTECAEFLGWFAKVIK